MFNKEILDWIHNWLAEEKSLDTLGVLATSVNSQPYTRTIAIREITDQGIIFFTQQDSKKVEQIKVNDKVSLTLLLVNNKRQITIRGELKPLSDKQNTQYWESYPKLSQMKFMIYGPRSGQPIEDNSALDMELQKSIHEYENIKINKPAAYVGYALIPSIIEFYQLNVDRISDSFVAALDQDHWQIKRVVP